MIDGAIIDTRHHRPRAGGAVIEQLQTNYKTIFKNTDNHSPASQIRRGGTTDY